MQWSAPTTNGGLAISKYDVEWDVAPTFNSGQGGTAFGSVAFAAAIELEELPWLPGRTVMVAPVVHEGMRSARVILAGVEMLTLIVSPHGYAVVTLTCTAPSPRSVEMEHGASIARTSVLLDGCFMAICETNLGHP